jgi:hypothetical protein
MLNNFRITSKLGTPYRTTRLKFNWSDLFLRGVLIECKFLFMFQVVLLLVFSCENQANDTDSGLLVYGTV